MAAMHVPGGSISPSLSLTASSENLSNIVDRLIQTHLSGPDTNMLYRPTTFWAWAILSVTIVETAVVLALEAYVPKQDVLLTPSDSI